MRRAILTLAALAVLAGGTASAQSYFTPVGYRGAFDPAQPMGNQWTAGWTNFNPQAAVYGAGRPQVVIGTGLGRPARENFFQQFSRRLDADTVYVVPLEPATRTCPGGAPAVWRSENGGDSWSRLARGLPKKDSYFTVLRDGMDVDRLASPALYFGTTTGQLWIGRDGGERWECLFDSLPPIQTVKVAVV